MAFAQVGDGKCQPVGATGTAQTLRCDGGITITAENGAQYTLSDTNRDGRLDSVELDSQALLLEVAKVPNGKRFTVTTPQAIAAVRGTKWAVDTTGQKTSVFVVNGRVAVRRRAERAGCEEQPLPRSLQPAPREREGDIVRPIGLLHRWLREQISFDRERVFIGDPGVARVWEDRKQVCPVGAHPVAQCMQELRVGRNFPRDGDRLGAGLAIRFRGRRLGMLTLLLIQMFPQLLAVVAIYLIVLNTGDVFHFIGLNTLPALIIVYLGGAMGVNTWLMKGFFDTIPSELDESARVDGATPAQVFWGVVLPLAAPVLAVIALISFISTLNEFVIASVILETQQKFTLPVGLWQFIDQKYSEHWGPFAAGVLIAAIPAALLFAFLQRYIVEGLTQGAVKG